MAGKTYPRVLVISHNVFSTTSNMGKTLATFFQDWESDSLAQLFFHSEVPNTDICHRYFRITDFDLLFARSRCGNSGVILQNSDMRPNAISTRVDSGMKSVIYRLGSTGRPIMHLFRNLLWRSGTWYTEEFSQWIDEFNPDIVFFASGDYSFSIENALNVCKQRQLPLIVYFGDEYYFLDNHKYSLLDLLNKRLFRRRFRDMFAYLSTFITASDKMLKTYESEFGKKGYSIMTSTEIAKAPVKESGGIKISYVGNLGLNRWKSLVEIGRCLKQRDLLLDIYSAETRKSILSYLNPSNGIRFHGAIPASKVEEVIKSSTIIIHVESMDKKNRQRTQYSMSTKIAESLGSGVCLFAYGPSDVSSIEYLVDNDAACVVTKKEDLGIVLERILTDGKLRERYVTNALRLAVERHSYEKNARLFYEMIMETCNDWGKRSKNEGFAG